MKAAALLMAAASAAAMPFLEIETNDLETRQAIANIDALFKEKGKLYFGTCADQALLANEQNSGVIQSTFGQLTPENSMKWDQINPAEGTYNWEGGDALVEYAVANGLSIRGHTLVWHSQLASWVEGVRDPAALTAVIQEHVAAVVGRWKGQIRAWDVVNEMFSEDGTLRPSVFSDVLGEDFVRIAFEAAREADPDAILYINDYNLDDPAYAKTTTGMADHVTKWLADGVPIDGIGSQGHLKPGMGAAHVEALKVLAATGVKEVATTELDIEQAPADDYVTVIQGCLEIETCVGVTVWGVRDTDSWRASETPLLFDEAYAPKPAFDAIAAALQG